MYLRATFFLDDENVEVELHKRTKAYQYGSSLIAIGDFDIEGLKMRSSVSLSVLGFVKRANIQRYAYLGPTYAVSGESSSARACAAVSALAQSLCNLNQVALCRLVKSTDSPPLFGALLPLNEGITHLFFIQLPFSGDIPKLIMPALSKESSQSKKQVADDFVDKLMLPDEVLSYRDIPNPAIRSMNKTTMERSIDTTWSGIFPPRSHDADDDPMMVPSPILCGAKAEIDKFLSMFPRLKEDLLDSNGKRKKRKFWNQE